MSRPTDPRSTSLLPTPASVRRSKASLAGCAAVLFGGALALSAPIGCASEGAARPAPARAEAKPPAAPKADARPGREGALPFRVEVVGRGAPMVLIPGLASSGEVWNATVERYRDRYECHVLTLAGFAGVPARPGPFLETMRQGVLDYVAARGLERPVVVGHSLGGVLALDLAATAPEKIGPVVIVDALPFLGGVTFQVETSAEAAPHAARMRAMIGSAPPEMRERSARRVIAGMVRDPAQQTIAVGWSLASDQAASAQAMYEVLVADLRPKLGQIRSPVLVLGAFEGVREMGVTLEQYQATLRDQYKALPGVTTRVNERSKHFIMWDEPAWFTKQVDDFLGARSAGAPTAPGAARAAR